MENKKILVTQSSMPPFEEYCNKIKIIWENTWLTNAGPLHNELEDKLKEYLKVNNLSLFNNGHLALFIAIQSLNLTGEVITTPFTFASTTHAIVQNGLTPVFCDINPVTYTIDVNKIESLITDKTSAIIPVHVYGNICDVEKIEAIANKYNLKVIYDSAHAFGVTYKSKGIGTYGDINMFSFHATKVFHTIEGGALTYDKKTLKDKFSLLRNFGIKDAETVTEVGINSKMNEFQAAMGLCNLDYIDENIEKRKVIVELYKENLKDVKGIILSNEQKDVNSNYIYFPILIDKNIYGMDRDELKVLLEQNNVFTRKYFYPLITDFECYKDKYDSNKTPIAKNISKNILTLPLYADLELEQVDRICSIIIGGKK